VAGGIPRDPGVLRQVTISALLFLSLVGGADAQISVNVDLVVLQATVRDRGNRLISDLREPDFEVYEDNVRQSIQLFRHEDVPVTVGLIIDHSGSMRPKLTEVVEAARTFARFSNPEDQLFVVNFNEKVTAGLPAAISFTNRADELERAIRATPAAGQTALYDAVIEGLKRSRAGGREKKVLIVISDGGDNASGFGLSEVLKKSSQSDAMVYTVGIFDEEDPDRNPNVLRRLAAATGGEAWFPRQLNEVVTICEHIARDIRNQYTIGYVSNSSAPPDAARAIRVVAHRPGTSGLSVRTRSSYMPGSDAGGK
jgi:Ca-activated chloride channel family protein